MNSHATSDIRQPQVSVIILNWNGQRLLEEFLPQVIATTDQSVAKIIVADNGSTDGSLTLLESHFPQIEVMRFDTNFGFAEGYNRAIALADTPYTVLLNSDVATTHGWVNSLYEYMERHPDTGACQPKILSYADPGKFEYAGAAGGFIDRHGYPYCRGRIFAECETDEGQYDSDMEVFWASGACLMVRTALYIETGGLDTAFFAHMEEIDLCWRIMLAGYKVAAVGSAAVLHLGGGSLPDTNPRKTYLNFRNNLLMLHKNLPDSTRSRKLLVRRLLDTLAWGKYVVTFKFRFAAAIVKAHRDFVKMRGRYTSHPERDLLASSRGALRSIVADYYIGRRRKFSDLNQ